MIAVFHGVWLKLTSIEVLAYGKNIKLNKKEVKNKLNEAEYKIASHK